MSQRSSDMPFFLLRCTDPELASSLFEGGEIYESYEAAVEHATRASAQVNDDTHLLVILAGNNKSGPAFVVQYEIPVGDDVDKLRAHCNCVSCVHPYLARVLSTMRTTNARCLRVYEPAALCGSILMWQHARKQQRAMAVPRAAETGWFTWIGLFGRILLTRIGLAPRPSPKAYLQ